MFAIRHPAVSNLWFDFDACCWTLDLAQRSTFTKAAEAREWATLPYDGGLVITLTTP